MSVYEIFVFLFLLFAVLLNKRATRASSWIFYLSVFALIAVAALRGLDVGTDTIHYYDHFHHMRDTDDRGENLYYAIVDFFGSYANYDAFMWFIYSLIVGGVAYVIYYSSNDRFFSLFLFVTLGFYTQSLNIMRQYMVVSIAFIAIYYLSRNLSKKGLFWFVITILISALIHHTALLAFLYIPILYLKIKNLWWYGAMAGSFIIGIIFSSYLTYIFEPFYALLDDYYIGYLEMADIDASRNMISNAALNLVGLSTLYFAPKESEKKWTVHFLVLSVILNNIFGWGYLVRVSICFGVAQLIAIPIVTKSIRNIFVRYLYIAFIILYCFVRFYVVTLHSDGIMPYVLR